MSTITYVSVSQTPQLQVRPEDRSLSLPVSSMAHFKSPDAASLDRRAYLVGTPISHSLSPLLHHTLYSTVGHANWGQVLYDTSDLKSFLDMLRADEKSFGTGVTMPYKLDVIPYLDELTEAGRSIGAVNTIFFQTIDNKRQFIGTNTDCIGVREAFRYNVKDPSTFRGRPGLVIGGGGTCRAAVYALQTFLGCSPVYLINRDKSEVDTVIAECNARGFGEDLIHVSSPTQAQGLRAPAAVVSAVPDFPPVTQNEKTAREVLTILLSKPEKGALLEMW